MSMKNSNNTIGNQNRDLPACSAVPQPTAPPRAQDYNNNNNNNNIFINSNWVVTRWQYTFTHKQYTEQHK
jgi:hypothetical protein